MTGERVEIGNAVVYHGDAYDVLRDVRPNDFGLLLTDPMWGSGGDTKGSAGGNAKGGTNKRGSHSVGGMVVDNNKDWEIDTDDVPFDPAPFLAFHRIISWGANHYSHLLPCNPKWIVWNKRPQGMPSDQNSDCELAWTNLPGQAVRKYDHLWRGVALHKNKKSVT